MTKNWIEKALAIVSGANNNGRDIDNDERAALIAKKDREITGWCRAAGIYARSSEYYLKRTIETLAEARAEKKRAEKNLSWATFFFCVLVVEGIRLALSLAN